MHRTSRRRDGGREGGRGAAGSLFRHTEEDRNRKSKEKREAEE